MAPAPSRPPIAQSMPVAAPGVMDLEDGEDALGEEVLDRPLELRTISVMCCGACTVDVEVSPQGMGLSGHQGRVLCMVPGDVN